MAIVFNSHRYRGTSESKSKKQRVKAKSSALEVSGDGVDR